MAMEVVPEAVGEAMIAAFEANAAYAAEMAALRASALAGESSLAALEAELAAEDVFISSLEAAEAMELYGGPLGWIAAAVTGGVILATALTIVLMMNKISQSQSDLADIQKKISNLKPPNPPHVAPLPPSGKPTIHLDPAIHDILNKMPDGPLVQTSDLFNCEYRFPFSRCNRRLK